MPKETLRRGAPLFVWLERIAYFNFEDEISSRRGECEDPCFWKGKKGNLPCLMKGKDGILQSEKKKEKSKDFSISPPSLIYDQVSLPSYPPFFPVEAPATSLHGPLLLTHVFLSPNLSPSLLLSIYLSLSNVPRSSLMIHELRLFFNDTRRSGVFRGH